MISEIRPRRGIVTGLLMAALCVAAFAAGCGPEKSKTQYSAQSDQDAQWLAGSNKTPTPTTLYAMAKILVVQGKDSQAEFVLNRILQEDKRFLPAYVELAEVQMRARQVDVAMKVLTAGLEVAPGEAILLNDLGMCHVIKGQHAKAIEQFQKAAAANPREVRYRANMAMAMGMMGRYEESLALYEQVVSPAEAHFNLAVICEVRQDQARAAQEHALARSLGHSVTADTPPTATQPVVNRPANM